MEYNKHHTTDCEAWKRHFKAMADGQMTGSRAFFKLKTKHTNPKDSYDPLRVVSETAQIVQQAKAEVRDERRESARPHPRSAQQPTQRYAASKHP